MSMSEALAEAYASQPVDEVTLETLELLHPAFIDDFGNPTGVRIVQAFEDFLGFLEDTAPLDAGEEVLFKALPFNMTVPGFKENEVPTLQLSISNVSREITKYLELAIEQTTPITVIYRPYIMSDPSGPQIIPVIVMQLTSAEASLMQITGTATLSDVHNWPFPGVKYLPVNYPGLVR